MRSTDLARDSRLATRDWNRRFQYGALLILLLVAVPYQAWASFVQVAALLGGDKPLQAHDYILTLVLRVAMPLFCLALGFWVAAVRPADRLAWIVLFLLLSFSQLGGRPSFGSIGIRALREIAVVYY